MSIDASAVARVVGITTTFKNLSSNNALLLPQRIAVIGQGATASAGYGTTKFDASRASDVGNKVGFGSPLHLMATQLFPENGDGVGTIPVTFFPLEDDGSGVAASGDITPTGTQASNKTYYVRVGGILSSPITLAKDDVVADATAAITAAINGVLSMPVVATDNTTSVGLESKWKGESANDLVVEILGEEDGITFSITQPTSGATNPDVQPALDQFGEDWYTMVVCALGDNANVDKVQTFGEGRWDPLVAKPFVCFQGTAEASDSNLKAVGNGRRDDKINSLISVPDSPQLPPMIAARAVSRIAVVANNNPPTDYGSLPLTGILPGGGSSQFSYAQRDALVKAGISTTIVKDGTPYLEDVVTFYHPSGDPNPAYRYVVDVVKIKQIIFNISLIFNTSEWDGKPLIPDDQPTTNPNARKPRSARAAVNAMLDGLGLEAIISDPETAKERTTAEIDGSNPKRLNVGVTVQISGNANIIDVGLNWGFYTGTPAVVA